MSQYDTATTPHSELIYQCYPASYAQHGMICIEKLQEKHIEQVMAIMTKAFCDNEPMTRYLHVSYAAFRKLAEAITPKAAQDGLSVVALDGDQVVANTIVEDFADPANLDVGLDPKFNIIFSLLESLSHDYFHDRSIPPHQLAHLFITAVAKKYQHHGLSHIVNLQSAALAKQQGFTNMTCEFTNHYNEKGTVKYLGEHRMILGTQIYRDYLYDGQKPFSGLDYYARSYLWEL